MRKSAAILLCGLFFFNWVGYRFVGAIMEQDAARRLDAQLDRQQYDEDQLITIKVPVTDLAYSNSSTSFERSSGQIEVHGIPYRYVESRIYDDSFEMRCIPNQAAMRLRQSGVTYFDGVNNIERQQGPKAGAHPGAHKSFQSDPYIGIAQLRMETPMSGLAHRGRPVTSGLSCLSLPADERPPASAA